ncbi:hypothetical protein JCGZ_11195 [Jatropha curcas]|uniref:Uncharacterized protein n=1 Tax=Jatropha curcas TaxID=180498 RepID=A0A067KIL2_JATCU|nr:hypothetical protein JCGZ_11195 [Jatropha curcas]
MQLSTSVLESGKIIMETQSLACPSRAIWHARAARGHQSKSVLTLARSVLLSIMETQILALPSHAIWHARATDSSLDAPLSTAHAKPSLELRLRHTLTVPYSTPVLKIKYYFGLRTPTSPYYFHGPI